MCKARCTDSELGGLIPGLTESGPRGHPSPLFAFKTRYVYWGRPREVYRANVSKERPQNAAPGPLP